MLFLGLSLSEELFLWERTEDGEGDEGEGDGLRVLWLRGEV